MVLPMYTYEGICKMLQYEIVLLQYRQREEQGIMGLEHLLAVLQNRQITFNTVVK